MVQRSAKRKSEGSNDPILDYIMIQTRLGLELHQSESGPLIDSNNNVFKKQKREEKKALSMLMGKYGPKEPQNRNAKRKSEENHDPILDYIMQTYKKMQK